MATYDSKDFDLYDTSVTGDAVWERYADVRGQCPVGRSEAHTGFFFVTGDAEVREAAKAAELFSSAQGIIYPPDPHPTFVPIEHDRPEHTWWRRVMNEPFTPSAIRKLEPKILEAVTQAIDAFIETGRADLVTDFAMHIPTGMIADILGFEGESRDQMKSLTRMFFETKATEKFGDWAVAMNEFVLAETASRRESPREDWLTELTTREFDGRRLDHGDLLSLITSFLLAGFHSTVAGMSTLLHQVGIDEDVRQKLIADPSLIPGAAEEAVRIAPPLQAFRRFTTAETTLGGVAIPEGSDVLLCLGAAARDERATPDPDRFDITRPMNQHVGWGWGIHRCLGINLARAEMRIALEQVLLRLPDYKVDGGVGYGALEGGLVMALEHLPVTFTPVRALQTAG
ncbi:MAG: cytochrome [Frankiales bacterium]|nr:cytochrome [Frankiales bacterium]